MIVITETEEKSNTEQNKKIRDISDTLYKGVQEILLKDEFNLFELGKKRELDQVIRQSDSKIQELIESSKQLMDQGKATEKSIKPLQQKNLTRIQTLIGKLK